MTVRQSIGKSSFIIGDQRRANAGGKWPFLGGKLAHKKSGAHKIPIIPLFIAFQVSTKNGLNKC